jgi:acetyltransferase-like isoleucine patch superfamily enzyme
MKPLLVAGPDSSLRDVFAIAQHAYPERTVAVLAIPSTDYYHFDLTGLAYFPASQWDICVAVNEFYINDVRHALHSQVSGLGYQGTSVVSPQAHVDPNATIDENVVIYPGCVIGAGCAIGHHAVLRANVVLAEDVSVGCYATLEANVAVREQSIVGDFTTICANSSLARMTRIGAHCYLNLSQQYYGTIADKTFYSPVFQYPVRVLGS